MGRKNDDETLTDNITEPSYVCGSFRSDVTVVYQNGLPVISVRLPSRRERCQFTLKPISDSVGVFLRQLQEEDRGIDRVAIYSPGKVMLTFNSHLLLRPNPKQLGTKEYCPVS